MTRHGLTLSSEEHPPAKLLEIAVAAEEAGFDFVSISDHYHPWIGAQGHSPFVWSMLGALSQATDQLEIGVGVTCPTMRIHPAVLAQAVATTACLLEGRFTWGVGSGENLNEHILGDRWPPADIRLEMLEEAIEVVRGLWTGESLTHRGAHYVVEDARIFDLPGQLPPLLVSAFGDKAVKVAARAGDGLWVTGMPAETIDKYHEGGGSGPIWSQLSLCWGPDKEEAIDRAHEMWPNTALTGQLNQDLRTVSDFEHAVELVDRSDMEGAIPCGPDAGPILDAIRQTAKLGVDHVYLHQIGDPTEGFIDFWRDEIRPELEGL
jgi:G6PDH family F420-dependent oxidoreductase